MQLGVRLLQTQRGVCHRFSPEDGLPIGWAVMFKPTKPMQELLKGCLHPDEAKRWSSHQLRTCEFMQAEGSSTQQAGPDSKAFGAVSHHTFQEYEWRVISLAGHEFPNSAAAMGDRYQLDNPQAPEM